MACHSKIILLLLPIILLFSCGKAKYLPQEHQVITTYKDSIRFVDSTIYHHLYKEVFKDYTGLLDTLHMFTTYATGKAYIDTTNKTLKGELKNKDVDIPIKIKWKERIVYKDSLVYIKQPVPYPVEVIKNKHYWYESILWIISIISLIYFLLKFWILK